MCQRTGELDIFYDVIVALAVLFDKSALESGVNLENNQLTNFILLHISEKANFRLIGDKQANTIYSCPLGKDKNFFTFFESSRSKRANA